MPITRYEADGFEIHETPEMPKWPWTIYPIKGSDWAIEPVKDRTSFEVTYNADYEGSGRVYIPALAFAAALEMNEKYPPVEDE